MSEETCPSVPTGPSKPTIIKFNTQNDRMNEPPPQPRVRKVTTIINTLGVIVKDSATDFIVWVFTACEEKCFPKTDKHMFMVRHWFCRIIPQVFSIFTEFSSWNLDYRRHLSRRNSSFFFSVVFTSECLWDESLSGSTTDETIGFRASSRKG